MISVRKILFNVFCGMLTLLLFVGVIGVMQVKLTRDYNQIIEQGGKILFQFNVIREQVTKAMLEGKSSDLADELKGIDNLNSELTTLLDSTLIPKEYKLALINRIDLPGIILLVKQLRSEQDVRQVSVKLYDHLRLMSDQLIRFDRVLASEMKARLVRFQNIAIGLLTIIVAGISLMLLFLYQKGFAPLIRLSSQLRSTEQPDVLKQDPKACREIADLTVQINRMLEEGPPAGADESTAPFSPEKMNSFSNHLNGIINYAQLVIDNVRLGKPDNENTNILEKILSSGEVMTSLLHEKQMKEEI